jgi:hypothetical protein
VVRFIAHGPEEEEAKVAAAGAANPNAFIIARRIVRRRCAFAPGRDVATEGDQDDAAVARAAKLCPGEREL